MKITANTVTIARIILLPVPCTFLIYAETWSLWVSFIFFSLLGATDFIDGVMARKYGTTKLGELIDPIADKIFIASISLSFTSIGIFNSWFPILILSREFIIVSLRIIIAFRGKKIKTTKLSKIKTIYQMGGFGTIFLSLVLNYNTFILIFSFFTLIIFLIWFFLYFKKKSPYWLPAIGLIFFFLSVLRFSLPIKEMIIIQAIIIIIITWISGLNYLIFAYKILKNDFCNYDFLRLIWGLLCSSLIILIDIYQFLLIPILILLSFELLLGTIGAIITDKKKSINLKHFITSSILIIITFITIYFNYLKLINLNILKIFIFTSIISGLNCFFIFIRWNKYFLKNIKIFK